MLETVAITPFLKVNNLSFAYDPQSPILHAINFCLTEGEKVGIIGGNGAGKTTLFLSICGILRPTVGEISLLGKSIKTGQFYPEVGFIFQNPDDQLFCPTVKEDIIFGLENLGLDAREIDRRTREVMELTGVTALAERMPQHLSGGEKCMVAIAAVLAMYPRIVLYDEPNANLDLRSRRRLITFLQHSSQTIMLSSHDLEMILEVCDRVIVLNQGQIVADGLPKTIMGNWQLMEENGLEVPNSLKNIAIESSGI